MFTNFRREVNQKALVKTLENMDSVRKIDALLDTAKEWKDNNKISIDFYHQFILDATKKRLGFFN